MSNRFQPPSEEELARRGIGVKKAEDPSTPEVSDAWEETPVKKKRGRPPKKKD